MYFIHDGQKHECNFPRQSAGVWFKCGLMDPDKLTLPLTGKLELMSNQGFMLASIDTAAFSKQEKLGHMLILSNVTDPEPEDPSGHPGADPLGDLYKKLEELEKQTAEMKNTLDNVPSLITSMLKDLIGGVHL